MDDFRNLAVTMLHELLSAQSDGAVVSDTNHFSGAMNMNHQVGAWVATHLHLPILIRPLYSTLLFLQVRKVTELLS